MHGFVNLSLIGEVKKTERFLGHRFVRMIKGQSVCRIIWRNRDLSDSMIQ